MNKKVRLLWLIAAAAIVTSAGCSRKPAYSEMDANRTSRNQNQNSEAQTTATPPNAAPSPAAPEPAPTPQIPKFKNPSFLDPVRGDIKDLPNYPRAQRVNVQIGPVQGVNIASITLRTRDPMDQIRAFFEQAIKTNHWAVSNKIIDPELSEWTLSKGEQNSAKVQVKKEPQTGTMIIIIVRGEKIEEPAK
jgi:hypothetical protein